MSKPKSSKSSPTKTAPEKPSVVARCRFSDTDEIFEIDALDLTTEEEILLEEHFDTPFSQAWQEGWITASAKGRAFLAFLARRRKQRTFSYEEAVTYDPAVVKRTEDEEDARPTDDPKNSGTPA